MIDFKVDIVGSFLRPDSVKEARAAFKAGTISREELTAVEDKAIAELVEKEVAHGLQFVTDGEFRRRWWHLDWLKEFDGFDTIHFTKEINGTSYFPHELVFRHGTILTGSRLMCLFLPMALFWKCGVEVDICIRN